MKEIYVVHKVIADEVEQMILEEIPAIKDVRVCLMYDDKTKSNMLTAIVVSENCTASEEKINQIVDKLNETLLNQKRIQRVIIQNQEFNYNVLHKKIR